VNLGQERAESGKFFSENDMGSQEQTAGKREGSERVTSGETSPTVTASTCATGPTSRKVFGPRWLGIFLGQLVLRVCPENRPEEPCDGCQLRALCKCAQDDFAAAARIEKRVWAVLAACCLVALVIGLMLL